MLELRHVTKLFNADTPDEVTLFHNFCFEVSQGEFVSIVGSNGSGKTTVLNIACGTLSPDCGQVLFEGQDITAMSEHRRAAFIGRVFQSPQKGTCGHLTILENMALADNKQGRYGLIPSINKRRIDHYRALLETCGMGLENRMGTPVGTLSGGQRQAMALVIAAMTDIKLLILDEHTAALDPKSSERVMELTDRLVRERGITTLMVTHNLRYAVQYGNRLVMMHAGQVVHDLKGTEKAQASTDDLLRTFNEISIECGN